MKRIICLVLLLVFLLSGCVTQADVDKAYHDGVLDGIARAEKYEASPHHKEGGDYQDGYDKGYDVGYENGYDEGYDQACKDYGIDP